MPATTRCHACTAIMGLVALLIGAMPTHNASAAEERTMEISLQFDRGRDLGQNFGTLFEAPTADGAAVIGAGFQGTYNTYHRTDRHVVQFFVRPTNGERTFTTQTLPRSTDIAGTYLFDVDGTVYSSSEDVRRWDEKTDRWTADSSPARERMRLGAGHLSFDGDRVEYDGRSLLPRPEQGDYYRFFYAHGHLLFYHTYWAEDTGYRLHTTDDEGFSRLYACPWTPDEPGPIDLTLAKVITLPVVGEVPFSYGQYGEQILTCSNIGGVYAFDGHLWRTVVEPEIETSYQVYSMINYYDRLLLAQYPTGLLFEYAGAEVTPIVGWPPVMPGVSRDAREAQTTAIYGGDLFVGVWPWAELWRYSRDADQWNFVRRMLSHPEITDATTHPYEGEAAAAGLVHNQWGQRVTSLVPHGADLLISTSAKAPTKWEPAYDFVGEGRWLEYGTVTRLNMPGSLSAPVHWTSGPTRLVFSIAEGRMAIVQDGDTLATTTLGTALQSAIGGGLRERDVTWGRGIFGDMRGETLESEVRN